MPDLQFPGGIVRIDPEQVWSALQAWLLVDTSRRCSVYHDSQGYCCRLTWDANGADGGTSARSRLGIADAVANALQGWP